MAAVNVRNLAVFHQHICLEQSIVIHDKSVNNEQRHFRLRSGDLSKTVTVPKYLVKRGTQCRRGRGRVNA